MGCKRCTSGLGRSCGGPLGIDDLSASCHCTCHECSECNSAYCQNVGGSEPCRSEENDDLDSMGDTLKTCKTCGKPVDPAMKYCSVKCIRESQRADPPYLKMFLQQREQIRRNGRRSVP